MFCSLEPTSGEFLDAYPDDVTEKIQALENGGSIFLGPDFFNATIQKINNMIHQKTPPVSLCSKKEGKRSIKFINANECVQVFYCLESKSWNFHETPTSIHSKFLSLQQNLRKFGNVLIWQWSKNTTFSQNYENDWCSYGLECSRTIEDEFSKGSSHVFIDIGVKTYKITFLNDDHGNHCVFAKQQCTITGSTRWVRRCFRDEIKFTCPNSEPTCPLCLEEFESTKHMPWIKTSCNHVFHAACFSRMNEQKKCPMCRKIL
jgi:hypothetical protein